MHVSAVVFPHNPKDKKPLTLSWQPFDLQYFSYPCYRPCSEARNFFLPNILRADVLLRATSGMEKIGSNNIF